MVRIGRNLRAQIALLGALAALLASSTALAQTARRPGGEDTCILLLIQEAHPARAEWSAWIGGGGGFSEGRGAQGEGVGALTAGGEVTYPFGQLSDGRHYGGAFLLRAGAWAGFSTTFSGGLGEGGLLLSFGQASHAQWGTYSLRAGVGYGDDLGAEGLHAVVTLTGGVMSVLGRYSERGACDSPARPRRDAWASSIRLFGTVRAALIGEPLTQWIFGIELTPSYLFPPYSLYRWGGGPP
jgi:hypothetical protein